MLVCIPSKGRASTIMTYKVFPEATVFVHSHEEADRYMRYGLTSDRIIVTQTEADHFGLTRQREWICQNFVSKDEWFVFADDNIRAVTAIGPLWYKYDRVPVKMEDGGYWRGQFNQDIASERFLEEIVPDTISFCESVGGHMAGFASTDNVMFRAKKFGRVSFAIGKLMVWQNNLEVPFDHTISMEDYYHSAEQLKRYGTCVVNRYVLPKARHYQPGGMGPYDGRVPYRLKDCVTLQERYPGLFRVKDHVGKTANTDLNLAVNERNIEKWRSSIVINQTL